MVVVVDGGGDGGGGGCGDVNVRSAAMSCGCEVVK